MCAASLFALLCARASTWVCVILLIYFSCCSYCYFTSDVLVYEGWRKNSRYMVCLIALLGWRKNKAFMFVFDTFLLMLYTFFCLTVVCVCVIVLCVCARVVCVCVFVLLCACTYTFCLCLLFFVLVMRWRKSSRYMFTVRSSYFFTYFFSFPSLLYYLL